MAISALRSRLRVAVLPRAAAFSGDRFRQRGFSSSSDSRDDTQKVPAEPEPDTHDDFKPVAKTATSSVHETIEKDIKDNPVMVYMKGVPQAPQCGFSGMVVRILEHHDVPFSSRDVLQDPELREGVKSFSKWPTVPQVYIHGEFVGGCDILTNMHRSGELEEKLKDVKREH